MSESSRENPIRVLQVFSKMYPAGAESMIMNLYRNIDREKVQFDFVVHTDTEDFFDKEIKHLGGRIYSVPRYKGYNHIAYVRAWRRLFREHPEYRIIHSHIRSTAAIFLKIAKKQGLIAIAHSHNTSEGHGAKSVIKQIFEIPLKNTAEYFFACSEDAGKWLFGSGITSNRNFYVLRNAIDSKKFRFSEEVRKNTRNMLRLNDQLVIGHVGRFCYQKNHPFLIQIFTEVLKHTDAVLLLVGDGDLKPQIQELCRNKGIDDKVYFLGNRADIQELMSAMDVFLFPSIYEGLPVTLVEAQAMGLPCLVNANITEEVDVGYLHQLDLGLGEKVWAEQLLKISEDSGGRTAMTERIQKAGFDVYESAKWLQKFYETLG